MIKKRIESVDVLRGFTIALMILVNTPGTWSNVYPPLLHANWHGLTPTDLIFPFFLFIVGISIYFAYKRSENSFLTYKKINTNLAKKRHMIFDGKSLRNEDEQQIRNYLSEQANSNLKAKVIKADPLIDCIDKLLRGNGDDVEGLIQQYSSLERQTLRQLIRNIHNAKKAEKKNQATEKLKVYLKENTSLGNK